MRAPRIVGRETASQIASASAASWLIAFDVRLHVLRRRQPHLMPKPSELARPVVRRYTRFQSDHTAWNAAEEPQHLPAPQSLAQNRGTLGINAVNLKNMLG
jgi:hypothetical protein